MSENQTVTHKNVGYSFSLQIEKESRIENVAKYPDKLIVKASLSGYEATWQDVVAKLKDAAQEVKEKIASIEKGEN